MARRILIALGVIVVVLLLVVASRPSGFRVERSVLVPAPAEAVFTQVNDFHAWEGWSPWASLDPAMKKTFAGAPTGVGSVYAWAGNAKVGEGRMTLEKSERPSAISIKLEFLRPFAATSHSDFSFAPDGTGTRVVWSMSGENDFLAKAVGIFVDMDKRIGGDFEKGLAALSTRSQAQARVEAEANAAAEAAARARAAAEGATKGGRKR
jgi:carbon monoxide dehydrogenase subunit G